MSHSAALLPALPLWLECREDSRKLRQEQRRDKDGQEEGLRVMLGAGKPEETQNRQEMTTKESSLLLGVGVLAQALILGEFML